MSTTSTLHTWLLESEIPSIRYETLAYLLDRPADDPELLAARRAIMREGPVPAILAGQSPSGAWAGENNYYQPKYVSSHWSLTLLAELGVEPSDARFQAGVEYMLDATSERLQERLAEDQMGFSCFWGNLLRYAVHAGRADDPRLQQVVRYAIIDLQQRCACEYNYGYGCAWGVVRTLWGLAALPERAAEVQSAVAHGLTFLLDSFNLLAVDYPMPDECQVHPMWHRLNFPLFYQVDILFTLRVLSDLDRLEEPGAQPALRWLAARRLQNGQWRSASPFRRRTWPELGSREETNRWVSLHSALVLRKAGFPAASTS